MLYKGHKVRQYRPRCPNGYFRCWNDEPYDKLLIATGSSPFILPVPGNNLPGVLTYRDLDDVESRCCWRRDHAGKAIVIGGGLLRLEAAAGEITAIWT